ncbi:MAG: DUF1553 domain-containing protein [Verrucomicrobiaceae bacterium]|nr:DUF1553 domain-containing protein [Verrucomicrobiaceae bacterium]
MKPFLFFGLLCWFVGPLAAIAGDDPTEFAFFENKIRPVLVKHCYECHSVESGKAKGGLRVDDREALRRGGELGAAVVEGEPGESLLLVAMRHEDPDLEMPPRKAKLPDAVSADFEAWIAAGAPDPREPGKEAASRGGRAEGWEEHWSYRPPVRVEPPAVTDEAWAGTAIDRFVFAELQSAGLAPSPEADPVTLLRRLGFALTGLPPSPEAAAAFTLGDLEGAVDQMLASEGFGVRWGRHWLDVVRYAESNGKEANLTYPHAWRYRDYVIESFAADLPYDQFLREQIAGDLIEAENDSERARLLIATGFLAFGPKGLTENNDLQFAADVIDEQIDALSRGMLASSIACARCHDHKSDPFTMDDYYALAGIFKSTETRFGTWIDSESNQSARLIQLPSLPGQLIPNPSMTKEEVAEIEGKLAALDAEEKAARKATEKAVAEGQDMQKTFNERLANALRIYWSRGPMVGKLETVDDEGNALPLCMGVLDAEELVDSPRYERGEINHPAGTVPRAIPAVFSLESEGAVPDDASGRLELARWVTDPKNPLTARVMVNRVWSHLFGEGLVETVDNFGPTGAAPSHPELLDYLAIRFQENGWSVKQLVREIVLSRTYRQASVWREDGYRKDPDNRLLWRHAKERLDAEVIRDAMLSVSGDINLSPRSGSLVAELKSQSVGILSLNKDVPDDLDGTTHRSVYLPILRDRMPDILRHFDFAEPSLVVGRRDTTNVPSQALYLMNSDFIRARAEGLARRIGRETSDPAEMIRLAFEICFNRSPDPVEADLTETYLKTPTDPDTGPEEMFIRLCHALLASADFRVAD